jgi:hypothetical protein
MKARSGMATAAVLLMTAAAPALAADRTPDEAAEKEAVPIALPAPPPGKGQIVFFRSGTIMGAVMGCSVNENGQKVSSLGAGRYFVMVTDPGRHEFTVKSEAKDVLALEVEPDETQFATCMIKMGVFAGRPDIRPATEAEFREHKRLKPVDDDDMGPGPGALRSSELAAALSGNADAAPPAPANAAPAEGATPPPATSDASSATGEGTVEAPSPAAVTPDQAAAAEAGVADAPAPQSAEATSPASPEPPALPAAEDPPAVPEAVATPPATPAEPTEVPASP